MNAEAPMTRNSQSPRFLAADHVSWTVPDLEAAIRFYVEVFGASVLYRMGPFDAADIPVDAQGRDWTETHIGVRGARLTLAMLQLVPNLKFQLVQYDKPLEKGQHVPRVCDRGGHHLAILVDDVERAIQWLKKSGCTVFEVIAMSEGPLAGKKNVYVLDPWGHPLEIVD
jgi:catechol 2,3-dioxygenase-like lactoylglutathione lyase family enzyme